MSIYNHSSIRHTLKTKVKDAGDNTCDISYFYFSFNQIYVS